MRAVSAAGARKAVGKDAAFEVFAIAAFGQICAATEANDKGKPVLGES